LFLDSVIRLVVCGHAEALAVCITAEAGIYFRFLKKTVPDISNAIKQQMSAAASFITWSAKLGCLQWHA
jgi:hypothetical protein